MKRRRLLQAAAAALAAPARVRAAAGRVLVVGAGWGGLAAARALRVAAPELDVSVVDRQASFRALPLSSTWLTGRRPERLPQVALAAWAARQGCRFVAAEVQAIDRLRRRLATDAGALPYDWLLLAPGAVADGRAWFGDDARAAAEWRRRWPAGFAADELDRVQQGLAAFEGGELLITVPPAPYRCPPAPYERALLLAWWMQRRGLRGRITLLDAGGGMPRLNRLIADRHDGRIDHRLHVQVQQVDPFARRIVSTEGELRWDHALLLPPMHAGPLVAQAGLLERDAQGRPGRWAAVDPATLRARDDERIWIVGDVQGEVSPLFGAYPKTAQIAAECGAAAALQIVAASRGERAAAAALPQGQCHVWLSADPDEQLQIETRYRRRGDGLIAQAVQLTDNPQPRDEDLAWARTLLAARLGIDG